jgi:peptide/nickel transport system ATP-binding protein
MYLGRIVETGTVEEVLLHPRHPYTRALLSVLPEAGKAGRPAPLTGEPPDPTAIPAGCRFHPRCPRWAALDGDDRATARCDTRGLPILAGPPAAQSLTACHLVDDLAGRELADGLSAGHE